MAGRFFWASTSDYIGRKNTYFCFFVIGAVLYALVPTTGSLGSVLLFVCAYAVIFSMYGGGFRNRAGLFCATCSARSMSAPSTAC